MKITAVSDLHGFYPILPGGDLLIIAGDLTARDTQSEYLVFRDWIRSLKYKKKIFIAGNHDGCIEKGSFYFNHEWMGADYLLDSGIEFEGLKIWGSPWTPTFSDWHFMLPRDKLKEKWDLIPKDTDILITHGPPNGIGDEVLAWGDTKEYVGCHHLRERIENLNLKLHVFGHVHEGYSQTILKKSGYGTENNVKCINCSIMNEFYRPVNKPINIEM